MRRAGRTAPGIAAAPATLICTGETTFSAGRYRSQIGGYACGGRAPAVVAERDRSAFRRVGPLRAYPVTDLRAAAGSFLPRTGGRRTGARVRIIRAGPAMAGPAAAVMPLPCPAGCVLGPARRQPPDPDTARPRARAARHQPSPARAPACQRPAVAGVEELGHDPPVPGYQGGGLVPLPRPRCHRVLPVLGRDPPVKREAQGAVTMAGCPAAPGALGPCLKRIPALAARRLPSEMTASRKFTNHRCRLPRQVPGSQSPMSLPARQNRPHY
jgi:hypothetical protein